MQGNLATGARLVGFEVLNGICRAIYWVNNLKRLHTSTAYTYQPHSPIGLDLELLNGPLKDTPKIPVD